MDPSKVQVNGCVEKRGRSAAGRGLGPKIWSDESQSGSKRKDFGKEIKKHHHFEMSLKYMIMRPWFRDHRSENSGAQITYGVVDRV